MLRAGGYGGDGGDMETSYFTFTLYGAYAKSDESETLRVKDVGSAFEKLASKRPRQGLGMKVAEPAKS